MSFLKLVPTIVVKYILRTFYSVFCLCFRIDSHKVTFASYRANQLQDNLAYIHKEMRESYPEYKPHYLFKKMDGTVFGKLLYIFHMIHAIFHLATSRYFIIDDFYFPIYVIKPRKGVDIIQLWHSAGALKKFGLSTVGKPFGPSPEYLKHVAIHGNYTKAYVSSREVVPYFAEAFNMPTENIYPLGIPRTDYFYAKEMIEDLQANFEQVYPGIKGKKLILYAPTFRGKSHAKADFRMPFDVEKMKKALGKTHALLVRLHPYMRGEFVLEGEGFAYHVKDAFSIQELLALSDLLITDYSTVFFDYSLLGRPMIFYPYDLEEYIRSRDFYYSYEDMIPGPMAADTVTLIQLIQNQDETKDDIAQFRNRFFDHQDGHSAKRIAQHIFG
ncbi:CDP-glycerol glycerophosphotransferase family protein [Bacillus sp. SD088]|uniref:CDP-glycerol glycerophosphotransferase family protein n=1 Tax=Bacillus sp. SD088 TaxID=2782012 RepID=UPI001A964A2C|nr:CDP-glycerol glycerophosphotransferase family protein [Bacillus sp. SD088]MBO0991466.1 CDP-glycerol glycerophosphotransferase family protein [Bacillus sp. SD088]